MMNQIVSNGQVDFSHRNFTDGQVCFFFVGLEPPPPPVLTNTESPAVDHSKEEFNNPSVDDLSQTPNNTNGNFVSHSSQFTNVDTPPMPPNHSPEQIHVEPIQLAPPPPPPERPPVFEPEQVENAHLVSPQTNTMKILL